MQTSRLCTHMCILSSNAPETSSLVLPLSRAAPAAAASDQSLRQTVTAHPHAYTLPSDVSASVCAAPQATWVT